MCLGIPGEIESIMPNERHPNFVHGRVRFGEVIKQVCLAYVPEAKVGDFVIVHAGFAISQIDAVEAARVWRYLEEMEELGELSVAKASETGETT